MFKRSIWVISALAAVFTATSAGAIAPGIEKIRACGNFTTNKYRVQGNQLTVTLDRPTALGAFVNWSVKPYNASGYCFVDNANRTIRWVVERGPRPEDVAAITPGVNEKLFYNLPGYGNVIVNRGQGASGDKQYFLVRPTSTGRNLKWYARCGNNSDQVYDASGKYVGYNPKLTVMFPYVCEVSPLKPRPPVVPQPR
ncbi:MAG: hypothetical protein ACAF41_07670 [Leptolyngbya sp. BL-A-14]